MRTTAANGRMRNGRRLGAHSPPKPYTSPEQPEGQDQPHRLGLGQRQDPAWMGPGLQRPAGHDRGSDRHRRRSPRLFGGLRPARTDGRRRARRTHARRRRAVARARARRRRLLASRPDAASRPAKGSRCWFPPDANKRGGSRPGWDGGLYSFMRRALNTDRGAELDAKRQGMIEPVFADNHIEHQRVVRGGGRDGDVLQRLSARGGRDGGDREPASAVAASVRKRPAASNGRGRRRVSQPSRPRRRKSGSATDLGTRSRGLGGRNRPAGVPAFRPSRQG
jgi:hypothetical protein